MKARFNISTVKDRETGLRLDFKKKWTRRKGKLTAKFPKYIEIEKELNIEINGIKFSKNELREGIEIYAGHNSIVIDDMVYIKIDKKDHLIE